MTLNHWAVSFPLRLLSHSHTLGSYLTHILFLVCVNLLYKAHRLLTPRYCWIWQHGPLASQLIIPLSEGRSPTHPRADSPPPPSRHAPSSRRPASQRRPGRGPAAGPGTRGHPPGQGDLRNKILDDSYLDPELTPSPESRWEGDPHPSQGEDISSLRGHMEALLTMMMMVWRMFLTPSWLTRALTSSNSPRTAAMEDTRRRPGQRDPSQKCHQATRVLWRRFPNPLPRPKYRTAPTAAASYPVVARWTGSWRALTTSSVTPSCLTPGTPGCSPPPLPNMWRPAHHPATWAGQYFTIHPINPTKYHSRTASSSMFSDSGYGGLSKRNSGAFSSALDSSFSSSRTSPESVDRERLRSAGNKISLGSLK